MNPAAAEIIHQAIGVYAPLKIKPAIATPWATLTRGACIHTYQPTTPCRLPRPHNEHTIIFADASGTASLTPAASRVALKLRPDTAGRLQQHHLTGTAIFVASSHGELKTLALIVDAMPPPPDSDRTTHITCVSLSMQW